LSGLLLLVENYSIRTRRIFVSPLILGIVWSGIGSVQTYRRMHNHFRLAMAHLSFISILNDPDTQVLIAMRSNLTELAILLDRNGYVHPPLIKDPDIRRLVPKEFGDNYFAGSVESVAPQPDGTVRIDGNAVLPPDDEPAPVMLITERDSAGREMLRGIADIPKPANGRFEAVILQKLFPQPATSLNYWAYDPSGNGLID